MNYLTNLLGPNAPLAATFIVAFAVVLILIGLTAWLFRLIRGRGLGIGSGGRGRQPRLAVLDYADVDQRRKLVLIRRDNVEHLLLLGGPTDVVVETSIVRGVPVAASALREAAQAQPAAPEPAVPVAPPEPPPRLTIRDTARQAAGEPPARPVNFDLHHPPSRPEPREPVRPAPPPLRSEPPPRPAPAPLPARPEPTRPEPARPESTRSEPARPEVPKIAPVVTPPPRPAPSSPPPARTPSGPPAPPADDVAARLEAALRKPIGASPATGPVKPAEVRPPPPSQPARPAPASPSTLSSPPSSSPASSPSASQPSGPQKALSADEKSVFDSLEEEMAALLGRGPTPPKS